MAGIRTVIAIVLSLSIANVEAAPGTEINGHYPLSYQLRIDDGNAVIELQGTKGERLALLQLPGGERIKALQAMAASCSTTADECGPEPDPSSAPIAWSPDGEFLMVAAGTFDGLWFIPAKKALAGLAEGDVVKVRMVMKQGENDIGLGHKCSGWLSPHNYIFTVGLDDSNFAYSFDPLSRNLKGFPFELGTGSTVENFESVMVEDYHSQSEVIDLDQLKPQLQKLLNLSD